jgi:hypothetical protein
VVEGNPRPLLINSDKICYLRRKPNVLIIYGNFCCGIDQARLLAPQLYKLFWGEQPPFTPIGRGGRYFFGVLKKTSNS